MAIKYIKMHLYGHACHGTSQLYHSVRYLCDYTASGPAALGV